MVFENLSSWDEHRTESYDQINKDTINKINTNTVFKTKQLYNYIIMKITVIIMILNLILIFDNNNNNINGDLSLCTNRPFALRGHLISFL